MPNRRLQLFFILLMASFVGVARGVIRRGRRRASSTAARIAVWIFAAHRPGYQLDSTRRARRPSGLHELCERARSELDGRFVDYAGSFCRRIAGRQAGAENFSAPHAPGIRNISICARRVADRVRVVHARERVALA